MSEADQSRAKRNLVLKKLGWGAGVIVVTQVQGYLPMLEFLPETWRKGLAFALALLLTVGKAGEMFFDQVAQLVQRNEISFDSDPKAFTKPPGGSAQ